MKLLFPNKEILNFTEDKLNEMDIQAEKISLIKWLTEVKDDRIIRQFISLQKTNQEKINPISLAQKSALDKGLKSIAEGKVHSHDSVINSAKNKYPELFK